MVKGINKGELFGKFTWLLESEETRNRPCVFFSHKREDKDQCKRISQYFSNAGIDYYLDEEDDKLQHAATVADPVLITESIKKGIRESTHMLVVVSEKTYKSQWVPFEIGYGHAAIVDRYLEEEQPNKIKLSILTLKDIAEKSLPDFMQVGNIIRGTKSLNSYISAISNRFEKSMINESRLFSNTMASHPLDDVLNWRL